MWALLTRLNSSRRSAPHRRAVCRRVTGSGRMSRYLINFTSLKSRECTRNDGAQRGCIQRNIQAQRTITVYMYRLTKFEMVEDNKTLYAQYRVHKYWTKERHRHNHFGSAVSHQYSISVGGMFTITEFDRRRRQSNPFMVLEFISSSGR